MVRPLPRGVVRAAAQVSEPPALKKGLQVLTGMLGLAALTVAIDYKSIRGFKDEQEFAVAMEREGIRPKPHRCNDRVEDFCQVWAGAQGSILAQGLPSTWMIFKCLESKPGQEPSNPYFVLRPGDHHYVDPSTRGQATQLQQT